MILIKGIPIINLNPSKINLFIKFPTIIEIHKFIFFAFGVKEYNNSKTIPNNKAGINFNNPGVSNVKGIIKDEYNDLYH